jgi:hypothetical protein
VSLSGGAARLWAIGFGRDVSPDGPQARQWLTEELAKDDYRDGRPLLSRIIEWVVDLINELLSRLNGTGPTGPGAPPIAVALVVGLVVAAIALLLTRIRRERRTVTDSEAVLGDLDLTAPQFRDRGRAAMRDRRWNDAVIEFTRAIAREAADRTLLADAPSLTAHEIGLQLAPVFPDHLDTTSRTMDLFDAVRYGRYAATHDDARLAQDHDETLRKAKPVLAALRDEAVVAQASFAAPGGPAEGGAG